MLERQRLDQLDEIQKVRENLDISKTPKLSTYRHKGFAFSGASGNDKLVTDKFLERVMNSIQKHIENGPLFITQDIKSDMKKQSEGKLSFAGSEIFSFDSSSLRKSAETT